jgi:hypothetical protein
MPHKTWSVGEEAIAGDLNQYLAEQVVCTFANAAARTSGWPSPPTGARSFLADTNTYWWWNGTAWFSVPAGLLAAVTTQGNVAGAAPSNATIITTGALNIAAGRRIRVDYTSRGARSDAPGMLSSWELVRDTTVLTTWNTYIPVASLNNFAVAFHFVDTAPPAGSHTYAVRWSTAVPAAGVDTAGAVQQRHLIVTDVV